jgi:predicted phosphoribosyltransferase
MKFVDRTDAGRRLATRLMRYARRSDVLVLGLPRGGVPVAAEVARALDVRLDVYIVRKLGVPGHRELAMGAIAPGGVRVLNREVIDYLGLGAEVLDAVTAEETAELARRDRQYRAQRPFPDVKDQTVILVDDGLATGSTMRAAIAAIKQIEPSRVVVAVPVAPPSTVDEIGREVDEVVCLQTPDGFSAVGQWYHDFSQTTDDEVRQLLAEAAPRAGFG